MSINKSDIDQALRDFVLTGQVAEIIGWVTPDRWQTRLTQGEYPEIAAVPSGFEPMGAWKPFAYDFHNGRTAWRRPLKKV